MAVPYNPCRVCEIILALQLPVLHRTFWIIARHLTMKSLLNIKIFSGDPFGRHFPWFTLAGQNVRQDQTPLPDIYQTLLDMSGESSEFRVLCPWQKWRKCLELLSKWSNLTLSWAHLPLFGILIWPWPKWPLTWPMWPLASGSNLNEITKNSWKKSRFSNMVTLTSDLWPWPSHVT